MSFAENDLHFNRGGFNDIRVKTFLLAVKPAPTHSPSAPRRAMARLYIAPLLS
ncbi:hypothetical protein [Coleofasciculus sp. E2-BRE-01]|uniref:hypothetical protein n=1 Tax=Coleofasciculus sp. E2-BRE-01 TaxID=3069524 RepID=UPI0032FA1DEA